MDAADRIVRLSPATGRAQRNRRWRGDRAGVGSLFVYLALAIIFFARGVVGDPSQIYIGRSADPGVYMWLLVWWPHAIAHHLNPFITHAVWAPAGFNLAWTTGIPLASLAAAPLTAFFGPVVAYNALCILCPALAGWMAFLLCRELCGRYWPALAGGYIFGFSAYMLAEIRAHLLLLLVFPIALGAYLVALRMHGKIGVRAFVALIAAALLAQFLFSLELFATLTMFGAIAFALGYACSAEEARARMRRLIIPLICSYAIVVVLTIPYLYYFFQPGFPRVPVNSPKAYSSDLVNFFIPSVVNQIGKFEFLKTISRNFPGKLIETNGYIGLPLMLTAAAFLYPRRRTAFGRALGLFLLVVLTATLGPRLHFAGLTLFGLPWKIAGHIPLIDNALPARFMVFIFLALAVIVALWLADAGVAGWIKIAALILIGASVFPNVSAAFWIRPADMPAFFRDGLYRKYLSPGENVIVIPYGASGNSMLWQAETRMYFRMAGGWTSIMPREFESWPIVNALWTGSRIPDADAQLEAFMAAHDVSAVLVDEGRREFWAPILAALDSAPVEAGGMTIYRARPARLAPYRNATALEMERINSGARFETLLAAAQKYLAAGGDVQKLSPLRAEKLGLLPFGWTDDAGVRTHNGLWLGPWKDGQIGVGVNGSYEALRPLIARYRPFAAQVYFPFPHPLEGAPHGDTFMRMLVITFDRAALARAAAVQRQ
ncbi:MAG: hypothetical protein ACREQN_02000 [Candidatus Binataceae bacterium]